MNDNLNKLLRKKESMINLLNEIIGELTKCNNPQLREELITEIKRLLETLETM